MGNGHPGTATSLAPAAYLLFQKLMRHDLRDPDWVGRDRFILSPGHSSLTPGHPEYKHTPGVEITTGPLGQGLASSVGFDYSQRRMRGLLDPDAPAGTSPFDHTIRVIAWRSAGV